MIELNIHGDNFELASEWDEVMFNQFIDVANIGKEKYYSKTLASLNIIAALSNNREQCVEQLLKLSLSECNELSEYFNWASEDITSEITTKPKKLDEKILEIDGKRYHLPGDCDTLNVEDVVSVETLLKDKTIDLHPLEIAFGMLVRELDKDGNRTEFTDINFLNNVTNLSKKIGAMDVLKHLVFFSTGEKSSMEKDSKSFSVRKM